MFSSCSPDVLSLEFSCAELVFNGQSFVILLVSWCKIKYFWKRFTCMFIQQNTDSMSIQHLLNLIWLRHYSSSTTIFLNLGSHILPLLISKIRPRPKIPFNFTKPGKLCANAKVGISDLVCKFWKILYFWAWALHIYLQDIL